MSRPRVSTDPATPHPAVDLVEARLRAFGGDLDRVRAAELLALYAHAGPLTGAERLLVLRRFPVPGDRVLPATVEGYPLGGRGRAG